SFLSSLRFAADALVGFVAIRLFFGVIAFCRKFKNFSIAFVLFPSWLRSVCDVIRKMPVAFIFDLAFILIASFYSVVNKTVCATLKQSVTLVATLFTFWPPALLLCEIS
ncbi:MAG TPA: hypothetical protein PLO59_05035, partial [Bacteroidia bacterium]|nr:hypothetical protein [Bacteroidia bacterium]